MKKPDPAMFQPKENESIQEIVIDFLVPGFMQNRLIASSDGPAFVQATRDLLIANVNYYVQTPAEADARGDGEELAQAQHKLAGLYMDFLSKRIAKLAHAITLDGIDKHIKFEGEESELDEESKALVEKIRAERIATEGGEEIAGYKLVKVEGPLSKLVEHWSAIAGGSKAFALEQAEVTTQMSEEMKARGPQIVVLAAIVGAIAAIATKRMFDPKNFAFSMTGVRELIVGARDISVISTIASPAPVETLFAMRSSQLLTEVLGPIPTLSAEDKLEEGEGCGNPDCEACNSTDQVVPDNVIPFPTSKTIH